MRVFARWCCCCACWPAHRRWPHRKPAVRRRSGSARTLEIDTRAGPRFGFQYQDPGLLADGEVVLTFDDGPLRAYTRPDPGGAGGALHQGHLLCGRAAWRSPTPRWCRNMPARATRSAPTPGRTPTCRPCHRRARALKSSSASAPCRARWAARSRPFFRFPYLRDSKWATDYLASRQFAAFSIDVDSKDYRTRDPSAVQRKVMADLARLRKGIILFHDIHYSTARALPGLLAELKAKGYKVVHIVSQMRGRHRCRIRRPGAAGIGTASRGTRRRASGAPRP